MLRKHINNMDANSLKDTPFFSWNCLTICLDNRDIDIVVKSESDMEKILKFLIYSLKTVDGNKGSGLKLLELMRKKKFMNAYKCPIKGVLEPNVQLAIV